jgi:hypothetical protein
MTNAYSIIPKAVAVYLGSEDVRMTNPYNLVPRAVVVYLSQRTFA